MACLLTLALSLLGCGYGEVSPATYQYAKALYSICNRRAEKQLVPASEQIEAARSRDELPEQEAKWLRQIIDDAAGGDWEAATKSARRMMEDQVK
jgi:hypothetical protein